MLPGNKEGDLAISLPEALKEMLMRKIICVGTVISRNDMEISGDMKVISPQVAECVLWKFADHNSL